MRYDYGKHRNRQMTDCYALGVFTLGAGHLKVTTYIRLVVSTQSTSMPDKYTA